MNKEKPVVQKAVHKIKIDLTRCHGHARCLEEAPQVFGYTDKSNQAYVLATANVEANIEAVDVAIAACPECAIGWVDDQHDDSQGGAK